MFRSSFGRSVRKAESILNVSHTQPIFSKLVFWLNVNGASYTKVCNVNTCTHSTVSLTAWSLYNIDS